MRLVDADEAIPTLEGLTEQVQTEGATLVKALIFAALKSRSVIPTVDAVPVKHGRWIKRGYACGESEYKCSACGETEWRTSSARMKYCMFCGAKMDGETDDHG